MNKLLNHLPSCLAGILSSGHYKKWMLCYSPLLLKPYIKVVLKTPFLKFYWNEGCFYFIFIVHCTIIMNCWNDTYNFDLISRTILSLFFLGVDMLMFPAAFNMTTGPLHWELLMRARANDEQVFVAACSPAQSLDSDYKAYGHSIIVDPWGKVIKQAEFKEEIVIADVGKYRI